MPAAKPSLAVRLVMLALACGATALLPADAANPERLDDAAGVLQYADSTVTGRAAASQDLVIGVHYKIPPFVGGSKVRTPDALDIDMANALAQKLGRSLRTTQAAGSADALAQVMQGHIGIALTSMAADNTIPKSGLTIIPTGYTSRPMAIMRADTDIHSWSELKGRTVCVSAGGLYVGSLAARYGALEKVMRAPADSLLALRTGECDAAVHDEAMLKAMLRLPEWKKFSASLSGGPTTALVFAVPTGDVEALHAAKALVADWRRQRYLAVLNAKRVRDIAFEVYLDQEVPDCH